MIRVTPQVRDAMLQHAEATYPEECCGALLGSVDGNVRTITVCYGIDNARSNQRRRRFLITADDYAATEMRARALGSRLIGFYHSHPDHPARPSEYDRRHALPWHSYVVVRVAGGRATEWTAWVLSADRSRFEPQAIDVEPELQRAAAPVPRGG